MHIFRVSYRSLMFVDKVLITLCCEIVSRLSTRGTDWKHQPLLLKTLIYVCQTIIK